MHGKGEILHQNMTKLVLSFFFAFFFAFWCFFFFFRVISLKSGVFLEFSIRHVRIFLDVSEQDFFAVLLSYFSMSGSIQKAFESSLFRFKKKVFFFLLFHFIFINTHRFPPIFYRFPPIFLSFSAHFFARHYRFPSHFPDPFFYIFSRPFFRPSALIPSVILSKSHL
jgi:hypothetical protein